MTDPTTKGSRGRVESKSKLELSSIRAALIRQEDTIIFALIERSQFLRNLVCYEPGAAAYSALLSGSSADLSFLDYMLCETERLHARVRRYTAPDEYPYFPERLPPPELPLLDFPTLLHPTSVNLNERIKAVYINKVLPGLCGEGDDEQHGSSVVADVAVLQAISKRVHYGLFVAESKFLAQTAEYTALIEAGDEPAIMKLLTNTAVEEHILRRVHRKASIFGGDIEAVDGQGVDPTKEATKVDPEVIVALYKEFIIPLTKEAEVQYLLQRLGGQIVACVGEAGGASHQAGRRAFASPGKPPAALLACPAVAAVFEAVMSNKAHAGVVPHETGEGGVHAATRQLLWSTPLVVTGEVVEHVSYAVASKVPLAHVRRVCGRPHALDRCKAFLQHALPALAGGWAAVAIDEESAPPWEGRLDDPEHAHTAYLCRSGELPPPALGERLEVGGGVRDRMTYLTLAKRAAVTGPPTGHDKSMVLFSLGDEAGGLATALAAFHRHAVNLTYIQSHRDDARPTTASASPELYFFVQFQGHVQDEGVAAALAELRECAGRVRVVGSYTQS